MPIRRLALPAVIAASGLLALGAAASAQATTAIRTDPGGTLLNITTTVRNTTSSPATLSLSGFGVINCAQTTVLGRASTNTSATTITGTGQGTYTSCTDSIPVITIESCRGHGAFPTITATATPAGGTVTTGAALARCKVAGTSHPCYYASAVAHGSINNATSTISYLGISVSHTTWGNTDDLGSVCGNVGTFSLSLTHGVTQSNQTLTITTS